MLARTTSGAVGRAVATVAVKLPEVTRAPSVTVTVTVAAPDRPFAAASRSVQAPSCVQATLDAISGNSVGFDEVADARRA